MNEPSQSIYVRLTRPEGYEEVHADLVIQDAGIKAAFQPEDVSTKIELVRTALAELAALVRGECPALLDEDRGGASALGVSVLVTGRVEAWFMAADAAEDWASINCPSGYSIANGFVGTEIR